MNWTMDKPTVKGWYWYVALRRGGPLGPEVVYFEPLTPEAPFVWRVMTEMYSTMDEMHGHWAGPLEQPPMLDGLPLVVDPNARPGMATPITLPDVPT